MTSVREQNRARYRAEKETTEGERLIDDTEVTQHEWTQGEVANQVGIHRTVLMRMERRGELPLPRWRRKNAKGNPYRVYNADEIENIIVVVAEKRKKRDRGRHYIEEPEVITVVKG